jgi:hypothetical protein
MSTYYATFETFEIARETVDDLLRDGILPEDISLVGDYHGQSGGTELIENDATVGDASFYVGRQDDPDRTDADHRRFREATVPHEDGESIGGADTSKIEFDVDTLDQSNDSQEIAEESLYPKDGISHGSHEFDDFRAEFNTGFRKDRPIMDESFDDESSLQDQNTGAVEMISVLGRGVVIGSGGLATAALDLLDPTNKDASQGVYRFLIDEGVPRPDASAYQEAIALGKAVIAVEIVPGRVREGNVEIIIERHGGGQANLFDGHRFRENSVRD